MHPCGCACCWNQFLLFWQGWHPSCGDNSPFICATHLCHPCICSCFVFTSHKVKPKKSTLYFKERVAKSVLALSESRFHVLGQTPWNCCVLCFKFYVILWNSRIIDHGFHLHCFSEAKAANSPEEPFPGFTQSWNSSTFLTCSLANLACLCNHLVSAGFLPFPLSSLCHVLDPCGLSGELHCFLNFFHPAEWSFSLLQLCKWSHWGTEI